MDPTDILVLDAVTAPGGAPVLEAVSLALRAGRVACVRLAPGARCPELADLAQGLLAPAAGRVLFLGADWQAAGPAQAAERRSRIGRVFGSAGWISNLNVDENVTLPRRHYTRLPVAAIHAEAEACARRLGCEGVPGVRPPLLPPGELRRMEWTRAFLGEPRLLLLEDPLRDTAPAHAALFSRELAGQCARGAAALWISNRPGDGNDPALRPLADKYELQGTRLVPSRKEPA